MSRSFYRDTVETRFDTTLTWIDCDKNYLIKKLNKRKHAQKLLNTI